MAKGTIPAKAIDTDSYSANSSNPKDLALIEDLDNLSIPNVAEIRLNDLNGVWQGDVTFDAPTQGKLIFSSNDALENSLLEISNTRLLLSRNDSNDGYNYLHFFDGGGVKLLASDSGSNKSSLHLYANGDLEIDGSVLFGEVTSPGTGRSVVLQGSEANIDFILQPKGTGVLNVSGTTNYEANLSGDDDIPNKKYVDDKITADISTAIETTLVSGDGIDNTLGILSVDLAITSGLEFDNAKLQISDTIAGDGINILDKVLSLNYSTILSNISSFSGGGTLINVKNDGNQLFIEEEDINFPAQFVLTDGDGTIANGTAVDLDYSIIRNTLVPTSSAGGGFIFVKNNEGNFIIDEVDIANLSSIPTKTYVDTNIAGLPITGSPTTGQIIKLTSESSWEFADIDPVITPSLQEVADVGSTVYLTSSLEIGNSPNGGPFSFGISIDAFLPTSQQVYIGDIYGYSGLNYIRVRDDETLIFSGADAQIYINDTGIISLFSFNAISLGSQPDKVSLSNSPTGNVSLAVATVGYANSNLLGLPISGNGTEGQVLKLNATLDGWEYGDAGSSVGLLPVGGSTEQVLEKIDGTDYNTQWVTRLRTIEITQAAYDALGTPDANTIYVITS